MYYLTSFMFMFFSMTYMLMYMYMSMYDVSYYMHLSLLHMDSVDYDMYMYIDTMSSLFMVIVYLISSCVFFYSKEYMAMDKNNYKFLFLLVLFVVSMNLMVVCPSMLMIMLGWDGLGLISYALVIFYMNESSSSAGMITVMTNRLGDMGFIMSIIMMSGMGVLDFSNLNMSKEYSNILVLMVTLGAVTKSAQVPFSAWLPAAMAAPTPVSSLVHSSTLVTAGVYVFIRMNEMYNMMYFNKFILMVSIFTMLMAGVCACFEYDLKKIIALSTLSQLGLMMMILSFGFFEMAFFHLLTHALFKSMLFLSAGAVIHKLGGSQDIRYLSNLWNISPSISMMVLLGSLALFGFPFLSGFYSKDLILETMYFMNNSIIYMLLIMMGTMFSVCYSLRLMYFLVLKTNSNHFSVSESDLWALFPIMLLGIFVVFFGCLLSWVNFMTPKYVYVYMYVKNINMLLIMFGMLFIYFVFKKKMNMEFFMKYMFFGDMFFLKSITSEVFLTKSLNMKDIMAFEVWVEEFEVVGMSQEIEMFSLGFFKLTLNSMYMNMLYVLLLLLLLMC